MNAPTQIVASKTAIWDALCKTDPRHTKQFSRAGGFKGTALKPIWIIKRLTEQFGPVGMGWGVGKPEFQVVPADGEVLVYCTVECWHTNPANTFYGVGGDKVVTKRSNSLFNDDEAFKKAFTDAVNNAFKFAGVGADIHMGQFEDSKYVRETAQDFAADEKAANAREGQSQQGAVSPPAKKPARHSALKQRLRGFVHEMNGCGDGDELSAFLSTADAIEILAETKEKLPHLWDGDNWPEDIERPPEFEPLADQISRRQRECAQATASYMRA